MCVCVCDRRMEGRKKMRGGVLLVQDRIIWVERKQIEWDEGRHWDREKAVGSWNPYDDQILVGGGGVLHEL